MDSTRSAASQAYGRTEIWRALDALDGLLDRIIAAPKGSPSPRAYRRTILLLLLARAIKTYRALKILCADGYGEDALILLRSLLQTVVTAQYLTQAKSRERVARYRAYHAIESAKLSRAAHTRSSSFAARVASTRGVSEKRLQAARARAKARFPDFRNSGAMAWTGQTLENVAEAVGQGDAYDFVYRLASQYEHGSFYALYSLALPDRMSVAASAAPGSRLVDRTLATSMYEVLILARVINRAFGLSLHGTIKQVESLLPTVVTRLRDEPVERRMFVAQVVSTRMIIGLATLCNRS